jgi:hypothetical protein
MRRWAIVLVVLCGACGRGPVGPRGEVPVRPEEVAFRGLCAAEEAARAGDIPEARRFFFDRSHEYLHELADRVSKSDRAVAAALLEAKERVESLIEGSDAHRRDLADALVELQRSMREAFRVVGLDVPRSWKRCE